MKVGIIILAAGSASRMGSPKQLLPFATTTILETTVANALKSSGSHIVCVLGANADIIIPTLDHFEIAIIENTAYKTGMGSSIAKGIEYCMDKELDGALILLGDQPCVTSDNIDDLIRYFIQMPEYIIATPYGKKKGVPAIFPKKIFEELRKLNKDQGARVILNSSTYPIKVLPLGIDVSDIDTHEDYQALIKRWGANKNA